MNGAYLYCITPPGFGPGPDLAGFGAQSVSGIPAPGLVLWVDRLETCPAASVESTLRHHAVVENAWKHAPACLPVRFGQWFRSLTELEENVRNRLAELEAALARVSGAGEHGIRIIDLETEPDSGEEVEIGSAPRPSSGRAYLEGIRRRVHRQEGLEQRGRSIAAEMEARLHGCIRSQRVDPLPEGQGLVSVAHLVGRDEEQEYARRVGDFQKDHRALRLVTAGPWPPYSFAP